MARSGGGEIYNRPVRRLLVALVCVALVALVLLWRIDNPRAERLRAAIVDRVVPNFEWALAPVTRAGRLVEDSKAMPASTTRTRSCAGSCSG